jgi:hypothetical protein
LTTIYSYSRWNTTVHNIPFPKELIFTPISFRSSKIELHEADFSQEEILFLQKYNIFSLENIATVDPQDSHIYPKISKIIQWHNNKYIRSSL